MKYENEAKSFCKAIQLLAKKSRTPGKFRKLSFLPFFGMAGGLGGHSPKDSGRNVRFF